MSTTEITRPATADHARYEQILRIKADERHYVADLWDNRSVAVDETERARESARQLLTRMEATGDPSRIEQAASLYLAAAKAVRLAKLNQLAF